MYDRVLQISESSGYSGMIVSYPGSGSTTGVVMSAALAVGIPTGLYLYVHHRDGL